MGEAYHIEITEEEVFGKEGSIMMKFIRIVDQSNGKTVFSAPVDRLLAGMYFTF